MSAPSTTTEAPGGSPSGASAPPTPARGMSEKSLARAFLTPTFVLLFLIAVLPLAFSIFTSLYDIRGVNSEFTGVGNYADAFTDPLFWRALVNTLLFSLISVVLEFIIGMGFALIMNKAFVGRGLTRAIILVPWVIPTAVAAQVWYYMFDIRPGFMNAILGTSLNWVTTAPYDFMVIIVADVWKTAPFVALLLLAGLQTIPGEVYEAARVDGSKARQTFWRITLPLLRPAIIVALLFRCIDALRIYDLAYIIGGFGNRSTTTLSVYVQQFVVQRPEAGYAATLGVITFVFVMAVGIFIVTRMGDNLVNEPGEDG